ncbi:type VI secretion system baseplate subunit TssE [Acidimangrovimonas sediminis]|uniref:type VI secretion system baseplate subunit TssE n=1 Tax=Acidimangrovimonas sediminis TaxID=2056283 RepID=UPI000C800D58|nr:GPW/gp25 family protein [Acidimangrovimonas sediminis]
MAKTTHPSRSGGTIAPRKKPLQVPLMYAFRDAFRARDARREIDERTADDARVLNDRGALRRRGASEEQLKANLDIDLGHLANTVNLASATPLDDFDRVRKSVLNFGLNDLSHLTYEKLTGMDLAGDLRRALLDHEPRLIGATIHVVLNEGYDETRQRVSLQVKAEMACRPVDVPLEFVAEIDVGSGEVSVSKTALHR